MKNQEDELMKDELGLPAAERLVHRQEFETAASDIIPVLELDDEQFPQAAKDFLASRLDLMSDTPVVSLGYDVFYDKFIHPSSEIISAGALLSKPYRLDDPAIYDGLMDRLRTNFRKTTELAPEMPKDAALFTSLVKAAEATQRAYFGNRSGSFQDKRDTILADIITDDPEDKPVLSIADLKDVPMCMERSVVEHNLFKILGFPSRLEAGTLDVTENGVTTTEGHGFLRISNAEGESRILDPQNPILVHLANGGIRPRPSVYKISPDMRTEATFQKMDVATDASGVSRNVRPLMLKYVFAKTRA